MNKIKINKTVAIIISIIILTVASVIIAQIVNQHQANQQMIDECFDKFETDSEIVVKKESLWSPVSCEKN